MLSVGMRTERRTSRPVWVVEVRREGRVVNYWVFPTRREARKVLGALRSMGAKEDMCPRRKGGGGAC